MSKIAKRKQIIFSVLLPLALATLIYILFRSEHILINQLLNRTYLHAFISDFRNICMPLYEPKYSILIFSLPSSLWLYSTMNAMLVLWQNRINKNNLLWFTLPFIYCVVLELFQKLKITDGTFDLIDMILYLFTFSSFFLINRQKIEKGWLEKSDKTTHWNALAGLISFISVVVLSDYF